jgi:hypothetical protein
MGTVKNRNIQRDIFSSNFKIVFLTVVTLILISLGCCIYLSSLEELSPVQQNLFELCAWTWKAGFVAFVYLICKKIPKEIL